MKRCITLSLVCFIISIQLTAQTTLTVFSNSSPFTLYVNGEQKNATPATSVKATGITGTQCSVRLSFQDSSIPELKQHVYLEGADNLVFEVKKNKKGNPVLRMVSADELRQLPEKDEQVAAVASGSGLPKEDKAVNTVVATTPVTTPTNPTDTQTNEQLPVKVAEQKPAPVKNSYDRYRHAKGFCNSPNLTAEDILRMKIRMDEKSNNEIWRAAYLKETIEGRNPIPAKCVTCKQYAELMNKYLASDSYKYDIARTLFMKVYDPGNYDLIRETLKDDTYRQKLDAITLDYLSSVYGGEPSKK